MKADPIRSPVVNASLDRMNGLQRTAEAFRYFLLSLEHWLSPDGHIREWLRKNFRWSTVIIIPAITAFPVVTVALWELEAWVKALTTIVGKLVILPILVLLAFVSIAISFKIISVFKR